MSATPWKTLHSSESQDWQTPRAFFGALNAEFGFGLDAAADDSSALCDVHLGPGSKHLPEMNDAMSCSWNRSRGAIWLNPPYGRDIGKWMAKAYEESRKGRTVVCLVMARTDTAWWHDYVMKAAEVRLVRGRLHFTRPDGQTGPSPCGSAVVVFTPWSSGPPAFRSMERPA